MRRRVPLLRLVLLLAIALVSAGTGLLRLAHLDRVVKARGQLTGGSIPVRAARDGIVSRVLVTSGDEVVPGQALLELSQEALEAERQALLARIRKLAGRQHSLRVSAQRLEDIEHPWEVEQAQRAVQKAELELARAETRDKIQEELWSNRLTTRLQHDEAELDRKLSAFALEEVERALPRLASTQAASLEQIASEIQGLESEIAEEQPRLDETARQLELSHIRAVRDGVVLGRDLAELVGQNVHKGDELLRLTHGLAQRFEGVMPDSGRRLAEESLPVKIRLDGYPWLLHGTVAGTVETIANRPDERGGYSVGIALDLREVPGPIYEGMKGEARILVEEKVSLWRFLLERVLGQDEP